MKLKYIFLSSAFATAAVLAPVMVTAATSSGEIKELNGIKYTKRVGKLPKSPISLAAINKAKKSASAKGKLGMRMLQMGCMPESAEDCFPDPEVEYFEYEFEWDYEDIFNQVQVITGKLELVEINGNSTCSVNIVSSTSQGYVACEDVDLDGLGLSARDESLLERFIDYFIPEKPSVPDKLEQCLSVGGEDPTMTLTKDKANGYRAAEKAFLQIYGGSLPAIHNLTPVDIKYPDGYSYTFDVAWVTFDPPSVELMNPRMPKSGTNKCS